MMEQRTKFSETVNRNFVGQTVETYGGETAASLRNSIESGQFQHDPDSVIKLLKSQEDAFRANTGLSAKATVAANAQALVQMAEDVAGGRVGDGTMTAEDVLNIAKKLPGLGTASLYDDPTMARLREEALTKVRSETRQKIAIDRSRDALEKEQGLHSVNDEFLKDFQANQLKPAGYYRDKLEEYSPQAADRFAKRYDAMLGKSWTTDESVLAQLTERYSGITDKDDPKYLKRDDVYDALTAHQITPQDATKLLTKIQGRDDPKKGRTSKGVFGDTEWENLYSNYKTSIAGDFDSGVKRSVQSTINSRLSDSWEDWATAHPDASPKEKREFIESTYNSLYRRYVPTQIQRDLKYEITDRSGSTFNFQRNKVLPQDFAEELWSSLQRHKPFDDATKERLAAYGLTDPKDIALAVFNQGHLYGLKPVQQSPTP